MTKADLEKELTQFVRDVTREVSVRCFGHKYEGPKEAQWVLEGAVELRSLDAIKDRML